MANELFDVTNIVSGIFIIFVGIITGFAIPILKNRINEDSFESLALAVNIFVRAAEQIWYGQSGSGYEKKNYVLDRIRTWLEKRHLTFDEDTINDLIESEVLGLNEKEG